MQTKHGAQEKAVEKFVLEKGFLDNNVALERRKVMKMKHRLLMLKENTRRRIQEQHAAEKEADAAAAKSICRVYSRTEGVRDASTSAGKSIT